MIKDNSSKFYLRPERIAEHRELVSNKNFVLIALTAVMSIYASGIAFAVLV